MQSLWMVFASALFSVMGACVKLASQHYSVAEIVFYRSAIGAVILFAFVRASGGSLRTRVPWMHVSRGAVGTLALALWFFATTVLPLGTAMTLNFSSPLFLAAFTVLAALLAGRSVRWPLAIAVAAGFVGVILVLQPSFRADQAVAGLAGLVSGVLSAAAYWHVRELGRLGEPEWRTVFYFSLSGVALGLAGTVVTGFSSHSWRGAALLAAVGITATAAQLAMTRAYGRGRTLLTANLQFSAVVFAALLGEVVFADRIPTVGYLGIAVIVASGVLATFVSARPAHPAPRAPVAEPSTEK
ncbi:MAG: DMT family transporter [Pseudomonadota bacterium]